jgi:hypothetical protein
VRVNAVRLRLTQCPPNGGSKLQTQAFEIELEGFNQYKLLRRPNDRHKHQAAFSDESRRSIEQGARLCSEVGSTINNVVLAAQEVVKLGNDMSLSASEQSLAIFQLNEAIREIDGVTQQNSTLVQRFVEATGNLIGTANTLANAVAIWPLQLPETDVC